MQWLKKHKLVVLAFVAIAAIFFLSRLHHITELPIFTDEAIYIRWSQIAKNDANWRFISLTDGKQPSFIWLTMIMMRFVADPLLAGRLVSVGAGFLSMLGLFFLGREVFRKTWVGVLSALLYVLYPMVLVHDRLALYDSLVGALIVWALYLQVRLVRTLRLDIGLIAGMVMGAGVLTKTNAFTSVYLIPASLLLFDLRQNEKVKRFFKWLGLAILAVVLTYAFYAILRLSPFFHIVAEKNALFVYPLSEWREHPFMFFFGNLVVGEWNWVRTYMTWPVVFLVLLSFFVKKEYTREKILLFIWFLAPIVGLALFGKVLYPRFILSMTLPLLPLAAFSLVVIYEKMKNKILYAICFLLFISLMLRADYMILTDLSHAPIPRPDLDQYVNDWPSGGGIAEAVIFFEEKAKEGKIYIATEGTFGLMPYALEIYLVDNPNVTITGFWPVENEPPKEVLEASSKMPTYALFYQPCVLCPEAGIAPPTWDVEQVFQFRKGILRDRYLTVYQVQP